MKTISAVTVTPIGSTDKVCNTGMVITFTGELGDVDLLTIADTDVSVAQSTKGQTAFRPAISRIACTATTSGSFSLDINGKTVSINYDETLAAVKTKIDALSSRH